MIRRSLRVLLNLTIALSVLAMAIVALEWYLLDQEHLARCGSTEPFGESDMYLPSPSVHHTLRPGARWQQTTTEADVFVINAIGLRGPEPSTPKPPGTYRVLLLGDEAVFAPSLPQANSVAGQLNAMFRTTGSNSVEVINGGVPGYCPLLSLIQYRGSLASLQPDLVVLNYSSDDIDDDYRYRGFLRKDPDSQVSIAVPHPALAGRCVVGQTAQSVTRFAIGRWFLGNVLKMPAGTAESSKSELSDSNKSIRLRHSLEPIKELATLANQLGSRLVVACSPRSTELIDGKPTREWLQLNQSVQKFASQNAIEFCDTAPGFESHPKAILVNHNSQQPSATVPVLAIRLAEYLRPASNQATPWSNIRPVSGSNENQEFGLE